MAFNNVGAVTFLAEGQSVVWNYSFGGDPGTSSRLLISKPLTREQCT